MAISLYNWAALANGFSGGNLSFTGTFDAGSGTNRLLLVGIVYEATNTTGVQSTSVKFGGISATIRFRVTQTNKYVIELWSLVAPATGFHTPAIAYAGTFQRVQSFWVALSGVDQTSPIASSNNSAENAISAASFPTISLPIASGSWGMVFGATKYSVGVGSGPPSNPQPFTTLASANASMPDSGGLGMGGDWSQLAYGAFSGVSSNISWTSNISSGTLDYILGAVTINPATYDFSVDTTYFTATPETDVLQNQLNPAAASFAVTMESAVIQPQFNVDGTMAFGVSLKNFTYDFGAGSKRGNRILPGRYDFGSRSK